MAKFLAWGRFMLFASLITQATMFSRYPSIYCKNELFNLMILLAVPTLIAWGLFAENCKNDNTLVKRLLVVWGLYVSTLLIPMIGLIFGGLREKLDRNQFFGPNILKMTMCGSPVIALLLITTASTTNLPSYNDLTNLFSPISKVDKIKLRKTHTIITISNGSGMVTESF
jgi:hypothetical protein